MWPRRPRKGLSLQENWAARPANVAFGQGLDELGVAEKEGSDPEIASEGPVGRRSAA